LKKTNQLDFKGGVSFFNDVLYLIDSNRFKVSTIIIVFVRITPLVEQHGIFIPSQVQFVTFKLSPLVKIGIICIYAQNQSSRHVSLWQPFAHVELPEAKWLVGGDFNNVELMEDRSQGYFGSTMGRREFNTWNPFLMSLGL
jgi:hypothetical protein